MHVQKKGFTSGCVHQYPASLLTEERVDVEIDGDAEEPLRPGKRLLPIDLIRYINGSRISLLDDLPSNGNLNTFVFAGEIANGMLDHLSEFLSSSASPLASFAGSNASATSSKGTISKAENVLYDPASDPSTMVDLYLIHTLPHLKTSTKSLSAPFSNCLSSIYEDVDGTAHRQMGVDVKSGALVVLRPDGYVGLLTGLDECQMLGEYFGRILVDQNSKDADGPRASGILGGV